MSSSKTDKSKVKEVTFRNLAFASDFKIKVVDGIVVEGLCIPCSSINEKKLKQQIAERNLNKQIQKLIMNYCQHLTYIHHGTLQRHVRTFDSIHSWCKTELGGTVTTEQQPKVGEKRKQGKVDEMTIKTSCAYYEVLFKTALYIVQRDLLNFLRNFWCMLLFAENVVEQGSGVDSLVTKKMYPKISGMRKKFTQFGWFAAAILFYKVLNETSQLSLYMESDSVLIYHVLICKKFQKKKYLPFNVEVVDEDLEDDLIVITPTSNDAENSEEFQLTGVAEDKVKVDTIRQDLLSVIQKNITERFEKILEDKSLDAIRLFDLTDGVRQM